MLEILNAIGQRRAFLTPEADGLKDVTLDSRLNGECILTLALPFDSPKWTELTAESRIIAGGREFVVLRPDVIDIERDGQKMWGVVTAQESWILLNKQHPTIGSLPLAVSIPKTTPGQGGFLTGSAGSALFQLLQGSGWTVGTVDVVGVYDLFTEKLSLLANIQKVQEIWDGFLLWDSVAKTVSLRAETWQNYTGFQVRYAKNLKHITRTTNNDLITRLYPFGQDELTISAVNGGIIHIDNFSFTSRIYTGIYQDQNISDPTELRDKATKLLDKLCQPRHSYRVNMVDLRTLPGYTHENFALGDMLDVVDEELGINIRARLMRYKYDVFQPWKCELEIGEPEERLAARLADSLAVTDFVDSALRPNPSTSNLLKGFVNTFATQINSANGKLIWNDSNLQAIEIDGAGNETGKRVRITPGGIGISIDGGQTYVTAMTGAGVLANTIIVNTLYALSTEDGHTRLTGSGLEVWDNRNPRRKRLHAGQYMSGKFGLEVRDSTGNVVILDEDGILQTWQEGRADNVDANNPITLSIFLPVETRSIRRALLRLRLQAFRTYATGAASGGGGTSGASSTVTTGASSRQTAANANENISIDGYRITPSTWLVDHTQGDFADADTHNHGIANGTVLALAGEGSVVYSEFNGGHHVHWLYDHEHFYTAHGHSHGMDHNHGMDHDHWISSHSHPLAFGIFTSTLATGVTVRINGIDRTVALGGPFSADQSALNIGQFLNIGQWNTITLGSSQLGRIDATIFLQALMGV